MGVGFAVEEDNGNTMLPGTYDGRRYGLIVIGSYNKDIHTRINEAVYLCHLPVCIVISIFYVYKHHIII